MTWYYDEIVRKILIELHPPCYGAPMGSTVKSDFAIMCRTLRVKKGLKQREVASVIGVKTSTYGNLESSPHRVIGSDKVDRMIELYELTPDRASDLRSAWERTPLSAYGAKLRKSWERRNRQRSKAKHHDRLQRSLAECLGLMLPQFSEVNEGKVCACAFDSDELCEVCMALDNLGLDTYTTLDKAISDIAGLQSKLEAERAQNGATP